MSHAGIDWGEEDGGGDRGGDGITAEKWFKGSNRGRVGGRNVG